MMKSRLHSQESQGAVLITTLIVLTVLAIVAVAFMQSTTMDQLSSRSAAGGYQARLVADAAVGFARGEVARLVAKYPDSVTVWQNIGGAQTNEATVLYVRALASDTNTNARPGQFGGEVSILARPLVSLTSPGLFTPSSVTNALPYASSNLSLVNLNATNAGRPEAFVGTRSMTNAVTPDGGAPVTAAQWVYIGKYAGPTNNTNPPIARYAYWIEDESFKVNVNIATNGSRGTTSLGLGPDEVRLDGSWRSSTNPALTNVNTGLVLSDRGAFGGSGFPTVGSAAIAAELSGNSSVSDFRFLTTTNSAGLDLSRGGFKRFNVNSITSGDKRTALNRVIFAITNSNSAPLFGQRFYRLVTNSAAGINATNVVSNNQPVIYLQKIAANLYDYIDSDDQPTIINNDTNFTLRTGKPADALEPLGGGTDGPNPIVAMGIENTPRLQEYAIHGRLRKLEPYGYHSSAAPPDPVASYSISIDHYFEFWNPGTRDITLTGAFLKVYDQPSYGTNITGELANDDRPFELPLDNITFPAGRVTVLTTAPTNEINTVLVGSGSANVISIPGPDDSHRLFDGETRDVSTTTYGSYNRLFNVSMNARSTSVTDYQSAVLLGNENGILESFIGLPIVISGSGVSAMHFVVSSNVPPSIIGNMTTGNNYFVRGGSLADNRSATSTRPLSAEGDPRALNEQMEIVNFRTGSAGSADDQTRFFSTGLGNTNVPANSTIGLPNTNTNAVKPQLWLDYSSMASGASNSPLYVSNAAMSSIGEIGHITDPARVKGTVAAVNEIENSRGGGRTLRVGQPEVSAWYDGNQTNASRTWTSWRLADIFTVRSGYSTNPSVNGVANAINVRIPGLINPNGVLRDNGAAMRAALFGFTFQPAPDGAVGTASRGVQITNVISNMISRFINTNNASGMGTNILNPFWERGEISELGVFNWGPNTNASVGGNMSNTFDRGREEIVRRSIEMVTTRGSVFTVYAIGQALQVSTNAAGVPIATNVRGTARVKSTFEITPQFANAANATNDAFTTNAIQAGARFQRPTNYATRVLASFYD
ncbi:MAG: hypothetical protein IAE97_07805 [Chthoniobacterales bacterium]|nr:hypothetical protein [Chthoniobacterales bacterium]